MSSLQFHLLSKQYIEEKTLVASLEKIAKKMKCNYRNASDSGFIEYVISIPDFGGQIEFSINTKKEYENTFDPIYYPDIPNYGANIIIGYYYEDTLIIPFLQEFLNDFPELKIYVGEDLPKGVHYHLYSKIDFDEADTVNTHDFIQKPPLNQPLI